MDEIARKEYHKLILTASAANDTQQYEAAQSIAAIAQAIAAERQAAALERIAAVLESSGNAVMLSDGEMSKLDRIADKSGRSRAEVMARMVDIEWWNYQQMADKF